MVTTCPWSRWWDEEGFPVDRQPSRYADLQHAESVGVCGFVVAAAVEEGCCTEAPGGLHPAVDRGAEGGYVAEHRSSWNRRNRHHPPLTTSGPV